MPRVFPLSILGTEIVHSISSPTRTPYLCFRSTLWSPVTTLCLLGKEAESKGWKPGLGPRQTESCLWRWPMTLDLSSPWKLPCYDQWGRSISRSSSSVQLLSFGTTHRLESYDCYTSLERWGHNKDQLEAKAAMSMCPSGPPHLGFCL